MRIIKWIIMIFFFIFCIFFYILNSNIGCQWTLKIFYPFFQAHNIYFVPNKINGKITNIFIPKIEIKIKNSKKKIILKKVHIMWSIKKLIFSQNFDIKKISIYSIQYNHKNQNDFSFLMKNIKKFINYNIRIENFSIQKIYKNIFHIETIYGKIQIYHHKIFLINLFFNSNPQKKEKFFGKIKIVNRINSIYNGILYVNIIHNKKCCSRGKILFTLDKNKIIVKPFSIYFLNKKNVFISHTCMYFFKKPKKWAINLKISISNLEEILSYFPKIKILFILNNINKNKNSKLYIENNNFILISYFKYFNQFIKIENLYFSSHKERLIVNLDKFDFNSILYNRIVYGNTYIINGNIFFKIIFAWNTIHISFYKKEDIYISQPLLFTSKINSNMELLYNFFKKSLEIFGNIILSQGYININKIKENLYNKDIILINNKNIKNKKLFLYIKNISLNIKNMTVYGSGLKGKLKGNLKIYNDYNQKKNSIFLFGILFIKNGFYQIYNKKFSIKYATITYKDNILQNPTINILGEYIYKNINDNLLTDGIITLHILGKIDNIKIYFSSYPRKTQEDIISYIFLDTTIQKLQNKNQLLLSLISVFLNKNNFFKLIQNFLNIDLITLGKINNLLIQNNSNVNSNSYFLSLFKNNLALFMKKNITSNFFITYGFGLLNHEQEMQIRIKINRKIYLYLFEINNALGINFIYSIY